MKKIFIQPILWKQGRIRIIDQTRLPVELRYIDCSSVRDVRGAIKKLKIRGAPLIGIAGAMGFLLGLQKSKVRTSLGFLQEAGNLKRYLASSRPTAVNLCWALTRMHGVVTAQKGQPRKKILLLLKRELDRIIAEDVRMCFQMSVFGSKLIRPGDSVLTICNAGGLATSGYGTALGVFYRAKEEGKRIKVFSCETRPLLQGARLTTWELSRNGIDVTLLCDSMAADLMQKSKIDAVFVGADRIASNGDFANKIGTYNLAVLAKYHKIPFYVVAPFSSFDLSLSCGAGIPIENRDSREVTSLYFKKPIAPAGVKVFNPSFDVTPSLFITAIVTDKGIIRAPYRENIRKAYGSIGFKKN